MQVKGQNVHEGCHSGKGGVGVSLTSGLGGEGLVCR